MTDTTPAPEGVTPEQVAAMPYDGDPCACNQCADAAATIWFRGETWCASCFDAHTIRTLAADLAAQTARADALEKARDEDAKDYCALMERHDALIRHAEAAKAKVKALTGAIIGLIPSHRDPTGGCWCPIHWNTDIRHAPECIAARAAITEVQG